MHTPGHTAGSMTYVIDEIYAFVGDTLFVESIYTAKSEKISAKDLIKQMGIYATEKYADYEGLSDIIIGALPSHQRIVLWRRKKNWQTAVWDKCKEAGHFTPERKSSVLQKLYDKIIDKGDVQAIKLYLTISGDYSEKIDVKRDQVADVFREINEQLHKKS